MIEYGEVYIYCIVLFVVTAADLLQSLYNKFRFVIGLDVKARMHGPIHQHITKQIRSGCIFYLFPILLSPYIDKTGKF